MNSSSTWCQDATSEQADSASVTAGRTRTNDHVWLWCCALVALALIADAVIAGVFLGPHLGPHGTRVSPVADLALVVATAAAGGALVAATLRRLTRSRRDSAWSQGDIAARAAARERERLARDLHDGLCQDLSFIAACADRFAPAGEDANPVTVAARRALATSRGVLIDLASRDTTDVRQALSAVADELAERFGITVGVNAVSGEFAADDLEDLVRITREAIVNAARHGEAQNVMVTLTRAEGRLLLRVTDDGKGMPAANDITEGFGMRSMKTRAVELGGRVELRTPPNGGTELEVAL